MTALSLARLTKFAGNAPVRGTFDIAADVVIYKGALVGLDSSGRVVPGDTIANGCVMGIGKASAGYDNTDGAAAAYEVEVEYGVFGWENSSAADEIAQDDAGKVCYVVDDQTVALTSSSGTRPPAGIISEVGEDGKVYVWMAPAMAKMGAAMALADAGVSLQKRSLTSTHSSLTAAAATETVNIGAILPSNARILGVSIHTVTAFSGGTVGDFTVDVGSAGDVDALIDGADLFSAPVDGQAATRPLGIAPNKLYASATQLIATFRCGSDDVGDATAGACTIDVLFAVLA